jgi:hypothetical protein
MTFNSSKLWSGTNLGAACLRLVRPKEARVSDTVKNNDQKRSKKDFPGAEHNYNPVNMAGRKTKKSDEQSQQNPQPKDDYNPVNMAGKKAAPRKIHPKQQPSDGGRKFD